MINAGNSVTYEVVLIAADKQIPQRLGIRLHPNSVRLGNFAGPVAEVGVSSNPALSEP